LQERPKQAEMKPAKVPSKTKGKKGVQYAEQDAFDKFDTKIKAFKVTKVPKQHQCEPSEHGVFNEVLNVLDVVEMQRAEKLNISVPSAQANLNIEGANLSRLRITNVKEKNEVEYISKTMTIKEYMCSVANDMIADAMKRVKENCSMDNIKNLAETIKKYRPESGETNTGRTA